MAEFKQSDIIDLDVCVVNALNLFINQELPDTKLDQFKRPLVVGSGNAAVTGRILFEGSDAVFADESTYTKKLDAIPEIDGGILISASGGKHAPIIAKELKKRGKKVVLVTCNENALAKEYADEVFVSPKQSEPYTYNTSTYLGMILAKTKEDPQAILEHIQKIEKDIPLNLGKYDSFFIIVPDEFDAIREMFLTKFDELFGPIISGRVFTPDQITHAKTVVPSETEMFISLGYDNKIWGTNRLNFPLPKNAKAATAIATGYYIIGKIQKLNEPYFKENIEAYTKNASKLFNQTIKPIVE